MSRRTNSRERTRRASESERSSLAFASPFFRQRNGAFGQKQTHFGGSSRGANLTPRSNRSHGKTASVCACAQNVFVCRVFWGLMSGGWKGLRGETTTSLPLPDAEKLRRLIPDTFRPLMYSYRLTHNLQAHLFPSSPHISVSVSPLPGDSSTRTSTERILFRGRKPAANEQRWRLIPVAQPNN